MKYIRTKDRIYETITYIVESKEKFYWLCKGGEHILPKEILKQSDTIEELCDEFVCIRKRDNKHYTTENKKIFDYWYLDKDFVNCDFYGAIWVKGEHNEPILKSVAKMNEKGELELL